MRGRLACSSYTNVMHCAQFAFKPGVHALLRSSIKLCASPSYCLSVVWTGYFYWLVVVCCCEKRVIIWLYNSVETLLLCGPQPTARNLWPAARNLWPAYPQPAICGPQPAARNPHFSQSLLPLNLTYPLAHNCLITEINWDAIAICLTRKIRAMICLHDSSEVIARTQ